MNASDEEVQRFRDDFSAATQHDDIEAQQFLRQLREQTELALGVSSRRIDPAMARETIEEFIATSLPETWRQNPRLRAQIEEYYFSSDGYYDLDEQTTGLLAMKLRNIERTAARRIKGADMGTLPRPLVGVLHTGQVNAVSMRVPGGSNSHLVLFETQMYEFTTKFSNAFAWTLPMEPVGEKKHRFTVSVDAVRERIESNPRVADRFANMIVSYAVTGAFPSGGEFLPPNYEFFADRLRKSLNYFVLGHEYGHVLLGHLRSTPTRKGMLPTVETETLAYSWKHEYEADQVGMFLSINAGIDHDKSDLFHGYWGIGLFFDALDVMDRSVALLQTGDENARQLGSHPSSDSRKQRLRDLLPQMAGGDAETASQVGASLAVTKAQGQVIRMLWDRTRPILLDLRRRGVPAARTWRTIPREVEGN